MTVQRTAGVAETFPYELRDSAGQLVAPASPPVQTIHSDPDRTVTVHGPVVLDGAGGSYTAGYPITLPPGTYYLRTSTVLTDGEPPYVDADDLLVLVSVTGSAGGGALVTLEQVRRYFGQQATGALKPVTAADDVDLQALIDSASQRIQDDDLAGPVLPRTLVEWHDGDGADLFLERSPALTVLEVVEYSYGSDPQVLPEVSAAQPGDGYQLDADQSWLTRVDDGGCPVCWEPGRRNIRVTYTAGRTAVPPVVATATCELIWHWWQWRRGGSQSFQPAGATGFTAAGGSSHAVPWRVRELLGNELRPPTLG